MPSSAYRKLSEENLACSKMSWLEDLGASQECGHPHMFHINKINWYICKEKTYYFTKIIYWFLLFASRKRRAISILSASSTVSVGVNVQTSKFTISNPDSLEWQSEGLLNVAQGFDSPFKMSDSISNPNPSWSLFPIEPPPRAILSSSQSCVK